MNDSLEATSPSFSGLAADKSRREIPQVFTDRPEELLRHFGRPNFVGVRKIVATGRSRSSQAGEQSRMQPQGITHIVESNTVGQLRKDQRHHMTPSTIGPNFVFYSGFPSQLGNQEGW